MHRRLALKLAPSRNTPRRKFRATYALYDLPRQRLIAAYERAVAHWADHCAPGWHGTRFRTFELGDHLACPECAARLLAAHANYTHWQARRRWLKLGWGDDPNHVWPELSLAMWLLCDVGVLPSTLQATIEECIGYAHAS